jgi:Uma2 family endonuclease
MSRQYRELDTKIQQAKKYLEFSYDVNSNYLTNIGMLLEAYFQETRTRFWGLGSTTFRIQAKKGGTEPDECYCIGTEKEFPDLAIEVVLSSGGVDKLAVYKKLGFFSILNYSLVFWIISSNSGLAIDDTNFASAVAKAAHNFLTPVVPSIPQQIVLTEILQITEFLEQRVWLVLFWNRC